MKIVISTFTLFIFSLSLIAQDVYKHSFEAMDGKYRVKYYIKAEDSTTRQGAYQAVYDQQSIVVGLFRDGYKESRWTYLDQEGNPYAEGSYHLGQKEGEWTFYPKGYQPVKVTYVDDKPDGYVKTTYANGNTAAVVNFTNGDKHGEAKYYYDNGELEKEMYYQNGQLHDTYKSYFNNGKLHQELTYYEGIPITHIQTLDAKGKVVGGSTLSDGYGSLQTFAIDELTLRLTNVLTVNFEDGVLNGEYLEYDDEGDLKVKGQYSKGVKVGKWDTYNNKGKVYMSVDKGDGKADEGKDSEFTLRLHDLNRTTPEFKGGEVGLMKWLSSVGYPNLAKENDMEGQVYTQFMVTETGEYDALEIARSSGHKLLDQAVLDYFPTMPPWTPANEHGLPVKVQYVVPVRFKLK